LYSAPKATALYEITRGSDNLTQSINTHPSSGIAATAGVAAFCLDGTCTITTIYDQSPKLNHITLAPPGGAHHAADLGVNATRESLTVAGTSVYAAMFEGTGHGYRKEDTTGVATGDDPETIYMVTSGTHFNGGCCFDYGNAETDALDHGPGTMEVRLSPPTTIPSASTLTSTLLNEPPRLCIGATPAAGGRGRATGRG
jgi:hypothetical protein